MPPNYSKYGKILFTISSYQQYRTYIQTQALKEIQDRVVLVVNPKLVEMKLDFGVPNNQVVPYSYPGRKNTFHRHVFFINSWKNKKRIPAFWNRLVLLRPRQKLLYSILSLPILNNVVKFIFLKKAEDKILFELVKKINPSMVLSPSHAFDGLSVELIEIAKKIQIPSMMVVENWDTLCTKTIFTVKPDYLGVWGRQQAEHATLFRDMPKDKIIVLGTPMFTHYMRPEAKKQPSPYPFKYILYVGVGINFDEIGSLKKLDEIIDRLKLDLKIVYRPNVTQHKRKCPDVFFEYDFRHVVIDTPTKVYYKKSATWHIAGHAFDPSFYPNLSYLPKLLSNMEFMICTSSTMILEAALFNKKMFLLAYDDGIHRYGSHWTYKEGRHLYGVERIPNVRMVYDINDMEKIFTPGDQLKQSLEPIDVDYFVSRGATANYSSNLKKVVDKIIIEYSSE